MAICIKLGPFAETIDFCWRHAANRWGYGPRMNVHVTGGQYDVSRSTHIIDSFSDGILVFTCASHSPPSLVFSLPCNTTLPPTPPLNTSRFPFVWPRSGASPMPPFSPLLCVCGRRRAPTTILQHRCLQLYQHLPRLSTTRYTNQFSQSLSLLLGQESHTLATLEGYS